ncbi:MAG: hypothetical protein HJJLKODD_02030 [Phycisphaerae bacterium]|nr:hypothetical protein [Phycisphaerae bacterium]
MKIISQALMVCMIFIAGCVNNEGGNGNTNDNTAPQLSPDQEAAVNQAMDQVVATSSMTTTSNYSTAAEGEAQPQQVTPPDCPEFSSSSEELSLTLNFGTGCTPELYPEVTFSGVVTGTFLFNPFRLALEFEAFSAGESVVTGSVVFSFTTSSDQITFEGTADLNTNDGGTLHLDAEWLVTSAGTLTITTANGTATDETGEQYQMELAGIEVAPQETGNFVPQAGVMTLTFPNDSGAFGPDSFIVVVTYLTTTPADGIVMVSVNGSEAFEYQTELLTE